MGSVTRYDSSASQYTSDTWGAIHQSNSSQQILASSDEEGSSIDHSVPENRLYERADGSIGLSEKSVGYVIGEQIMNLSH